MLKIRVLLPFIILASLLSSANANPPPFDVEELTGVYVANNAEIQTLFSRIESASRMIGMMDADDPWVPHLQAALDEKRAHGAALVIQNSWIRFLFDIYGIGNVLDQAVMQYYLDNGL